MSLKLLTYGRQIVPRCQFPAVFQAALASRFSATTFRRPYDGICRYYNGCGKSTNRSNRAARREPRKPAIKREIPPVRPRRPLYCLPRKPPKRSSDQVTQWQRNFPGRKQRRCIQRPARTGKVWNVERAIQLVRVSGEHSTLSAETEGARLKQL